HLLTLERPIEINQHVWDLLTRADGTAPHTDPMVVNRDGARRKPPTGVSPLSPSCPGQEVVGGEPPEPPPQAVAE
ncbi:hypothetical protein, partial [Actinomadura sp. HBU206391]|uniref:hypothetical protein n=1 Tax=Actinomadura sp. HBU206391 TaxID=2731692 RepID=UPI001C9CE814